LEDWRGEREGIERRERCRGEKTRRVKLIEGGRGDRVWRSLVCPLVAVDGVAFALSTDIRIINFPTTGGEDVFVPLVPSPLDHLARVRLVLLHSDILNHSEISRERDRERGREREP
jgi:predicted small integral membrane protein